MTCAFEFCRGEKLTMKEMSSKFDEVIRVSGVLEFRVAYRAESESYAIRELEQYRNRVSLEETKKLGR